MDGAKSCFELVTQQSTLPNDDASNDAPTYASFWTRTYNALGFRPIGSKLDTHWALRSSTFSYYERCWWYDLCHDA